MATTNFVNGTVVQPEWLNDVNDLVYEFTQSGVGAVARTAQSKMRDIVSVTDFGAVGDGVTNDTAAINLAIAAAVKVYFPPGVYMTDGGHNITGKEISGASRESSIIKARGINSAVTIFVNGRTDHITPGTWGSGQNFRIENLGIRGNWDKITGMTSVTESGATTNVGVLKADYTPAQSALVRGISAAYCNIINCYIDDAWEHGVLFYRLGYSEITGNIIARCRGSGIWLTADSAANAITSTIVERNQIVANRGGYGGLRTLYTYGCAIRDNRPFEDNTWGATFGEGADTDISGNYFEINPFGDADIDPSIWGLTLVNNYWTIPPVLPSGPSARGFFSYDRKNGLRHLCVGGLGETDNRLGPIRYSSETDTIGIGRATLPASNGSGLTFPAPAAPSSDPNTLDDYQEEGWNVTDASGASLSLAVTGQYTKVGNVVTFVCSVVFPTTSNTASVTIGGLPVAAAALTPISVVSNHAGGLSGFIPSGTATIKFTGQGTFTEKTNANLSGAVLYVSGSYRATA